MTLWSLILIALTGITAISCSDEICPGSPDADSEYLTLHLKSVSRSSRSAERPLDDSNNEDLIENARVFLLPSSADAAVPVIVSEPFSLNQNEEADVKVRFDRDLIPDLFVNGSEAYAYVIANLPTDKVSELEGKKLGELKAITIESDFAKNADQSSFVMDGGITIVKEENGSLMTILGKDNSPVYLTRAAAKIALNVKIAPAVEDAYGVTWEPTGVGNMNVYITNGLKKSAVTPSSYTPEFPTDYFSTSLGDENAPARGFTEKTDETSTDEDKTYYAQQRAFYTYPNSWTDDSEQMTYLTLSIQFTNGEGSFRTCYYMVPVVAKETSLTRNVSYTVNINVKILGSTKPTEPTTVEASYRAIDWGQEDVNVSINDYRYLVLDQTEYTINNESSIAIPFYSSHETVIKYDLDELNYYLYNTTAAGIEKEMTVDNTVRNNSTTTVLPDSTGRSVKMFSDWIVNDVDPSTNTRTLNFHHELYQWTPQKSTAGGRYTNLSAGTNGNGGTGFGPYTSEANANGQLNLITRYVLNNTNTPSYCAYKMTITIVHKDKIGKPDETRYTKKIVITQYPAIYIQTTQNFYGGSDRNVRTPERGNMYVNGNQQYFATDQWDYTWSNRWYVAYGLGGTSANANPNQYVVAITNLSAGSDYVIGDPRVKTPNNLTNNFTGTAPADGWANAPAITDGTNGNVDDVPTNKYRKLTNYYPTDDDKNKMNVVAPKIRVASSYGVAGKPTYANAQRRCASYQEMAYPAGRWRIPTKGEIEYIMKLSVDNKIPVLFTSGTNYWSAEGPITATLNDNGKLKDPANYNNNTTSGIRCVYDEWYWEKTDYPVLKTNNTQTYGTETFEKYPFTWGDMPISQNN